MDSLFTHSKYEDTLQCFLFSTVKLCKIEWEELCESLNKTITSLSKDYIWHRDAVKIVLPVTTEVTNDTPTHLVSTTCFGDNIEDEWFIVYLMLEITKEYKHLIIQMEDSDGDFLLIESAKYLPAWANPETTINRVFIYNQHAHLIPQTIVSTESPLALADALSMISQKPEETRLPLEAEQAIMKRIGKYPEKIRENCHTAILTLPIEIATVLALKPSLISPLVSTYCSLDALDFKHFKDIKFEDCINVEVTFTKYLYAMLFQSDVPIYLKRYNLTREKKTELGSKLTYAYRIIMSRLVKDISCTPEFKKFLNNLTKNGYFKNNIKDSQEYSELLEKAKIYFLDMECSTSLYVSNLINELILCGKFNETRDLVIKKSETGVLKEDDDKWLNVDPKQLNDFLNKRYGKDIKLKNNDTMTLHTLTSTLSNYLKGTSDFEGVEHRNEISEDESIDFDPDEFVKCLEKTLTLIISKTQPESDSDDDNVDICESKESLGPLDIELTSKLISDENTCFSSDSNIEEKVLRNLSQSMKEEGLTGPASTLLRQIGFEKSNILDSDDDDDDS